MQGGDVTDKTAWTESMVTKGIMSASYSSELTAECWQLLAC